MKRTSLFDFHSRNGKVVEFAGYEMPLWYTSTIEEHMAVRTSSGIFDVSHMGRVSVRGPEAVQFLDHLVPTSVSAQAVGRSFYTLLLNQNGGILDDIIIMKSEHEYLIVVNAANRTKDLSHMRGVAVPYKVEITDHTDSSTMIAVQGPNAKQSLQPLTPANLSSIERHTHIHCRVQDEKAIITRSGYTGEDGYEVILQESGVENNTGAMSVWTTLAGTSKPCGLGARDSLRTEAGLALYGPDINETTNPYDADLAWVITKDKGGYLGSEALVAYSQSGRQRIRRGIVLDDKIPRHDFLVTTLEKQVIGKVTSGTFSPILKKGIALAYVDLPHSAIGERVEVDVRGSTAPGTIVKPPFYDQQLYGWKRSKQ